MDTLLPSQPENYIQLIKRSLILYKNSFKDVFLLAFIFACIVFIPRFLSIVIGQAIFFKIAPLDPSHLWIFLINLIGIIFFLSLLWRIHGIIYHRHEPLKEDLAVGTRKMLSVFIAAIIQAAILFGITIIFFESQLLINKYLNILTLPTASFTSFIMVGLIFLVEFFLIVYLYTLFTFFAPLIAIENRGIFSALKKSAWLVWNHWWRTFSVQATPWLSYLILLIIIRFLFQVKIHIYFVEQTTYTFMATVLHLFLFTFFIIWVAILLLVQLKDLELRKKLSRAAI